ncbi:hypothetical protein OSB04_014053 [Centaurea solstitialis]|uniref:Protein kinase domain-containing protein n=1 Tax=Centaurea solstitialis TaxID=347529 RepID=A0AA38TEF2_9ASTR|nr:hypothetical protein OSB04_014053 [Centaurea solstitialis]
MVFHCRCLSFSFEEEGEQAVSIVFKEKEEKSPAYYTPGSHFDPSPAAPDCRAPDSRATNNNLRVFTLSELKAITNNFSKSREGGFGYVYMGVIQNPQDSTKTLDVAVKWLGETRLEGHNEWVKEVNVLGVVEHPNLVKLVGYCAQDDERLLVYEYMPNRSVKDHLSRRSEAHLSWTMKLKVAQDVARGLAYLHEQMDFPVIFRDLTSSNILLDDQWNAKLFDFISARLGPIGLTYGLTAGVIAAGYMAPEYIKTRLVTTESDIWSYGVFLYELITGRLPLDTTRPMTKQKLLEWVKPNIDSERFKLIIDPRLEDNYSLESAQKLSIIANKCLSIDPESRPKMSEVLEMVNQLITRVPSQASPINGLVSVAAIEPKMVLTHVNTIHEDMKSEDEPKTTEIQHKKSSYSKFLVDHEYPSPEYVRARHLTSMCDVWSYGVFLYELITGRLRFGYELTQERAEASRAGENLHHAQKGRFWLIIDPSSNMPCLTNYI